VLFPTAIPQLTGSPFAKHTLPPQSHLHVNMSPLQWQPPLSAPLEYE